VTTPAAAMLEPWRNTNEAPLQDRCRQSTVPATNYSPHRKSSIENKINSHDKTTKTPKVVINPSIMKPKEYLYSPSQ